MKSLTVKYWSCSLPLSRLLSEQEDSNRNTSSLLVLVVFLHEIVVVALVLGMYTYFYNTVPLVSRLCTNKNIYRYSGVIRLYLTALERSVGQTNSKYSTSS